MISCWTQNRDLLASYRSTDGVLDIRRIGAAEYAGFVPLDAVVPPDSGIVGDVIAGNHRRITWIDYESRKLSVERNAGLFLEADVSPVRRFISEHRCVIDPPKRLYLDIETDARVPVMEAVAGHARILCWACEDDFGHRYSGLLEEDTNKDEKRILEELWAVMAQYDQICGWYADGFDFPVIEARTKKHRVWPDARRRLLFLDHLAAFKRLNTASKSGDEKTSMALGAIAHALLGEGKHDFDSRKTWEAWSAGGEERARLLRYCVQDTALLPRIEAETGYLALFQTLCEATLSLPNSRGLNPGGQVDGFMLRKGHLAGIHFPTKIDHEGEQYTGAYVLKPTVGGIERNVHVCDFKSLYPTVIRSWNISPETKGKPGCKAPSTGITFSTDVEGMLAGSCRELMELRDKWKKLKNSLPPGTPEWEAADRTSTAYKVAVNAFYGVMGSVWSRFYDRELVESITLGAQFLIKATITETEKRGWKCLYGDSITADRTVVLRDPSGNVTILPIERVWQLATDQTSARDKEFGRLHGWMALTELGWKPVRTIIRHECAKVIHTITTKHGQTSVTEDHGIMCDGKKTRPVDFTKFTKVAAPLEVPFETLDLYQYVKDFVNSTPYKGRQLVRRFIADDDWLYLDGWGDPYSVRIRRYYTRGTPEADALIRLVTFYTSDGSASISGATACRYMLSFCKSNETWMRQIAFDLQSIFDGGEVFGPYWTETVLVVRSGTAAMACLFAALCGYKSRGKRLPSFMYQLDPAGFEVFREALIHGDGPLDNIGRIKFTSNSQELTAGVSYVFTQHGTEHAFMYRESKHAWSLRTRPSGVERKRCQVKHHITDDYNGYVYDLTVDGAHTFVDGIGQVLLHNTDSLFVTGCTDDEFREFTGWCTDVLYPRLLGELGCNPLQHCIGLAYEKAFRLMVFPLNKDLEPSAKRYIGAYSHYGGKQATADSKPEIKGLEFMRGDSLRLTRAMQSEAITRLLADTYTDTQMMEWVMTWRERICAGNLPLEDVQLTRGLGRDIVSYSNATMPAHVAIAKILKARGEDVSAGTRIEYVVTDGDTSPMTTIPASDYHGEYDARWMWNKQVAPATIRLLAGAYPNLNWYRPILKKPKKPLAGQIGLFV